MSVTKDDVKYVAGLARLQLTPDETERLTGDMNRILEYIDLLEEVDTSDVEPLEHVSEFTAGFRRDIAKDPLPHEDALKNAPDADSDYFRVPKVIE